MAMNNDASNKNFDRDDFDEQKQWYNFNRSKAMLTTLGTHSKSQTSQNFKAEEEQILTQKMSQLSTSVTTEHEFLIKPIENALKNIPSYLTKRNQSFQLMLNQALAMMAIEVSNSYRDKLRHIVILLYKVLVLQMYLRRWRTYLKSGVGELITDKEKQFIYSTNYQIWPKEIKTILQISKTNKTNEHKICIDFIYQTLNQLDRLLKEIVMELNKEIKNLHGYTLTVDKFIQTYLEQNLSSLRMEIEHEIELVHFDYHIHALKLEYHRHNPNEYQKNLFKRICQTKYEQELTEQEYQFLQIQTNYYNSFEQSFENSPIAQSTLINSIENHKIRQQLYDHYKSIAEQSKVQLTTFYLKTAEEQRNEYRKKYNDLINKVWSDRHTMADSDKISMNMIHFMNERCKKIGDRLQSIYKFKSQTFLQTKSN